MATDTKINPRWHQSSFHTPKITPCLQRACSNNCRSCFYCIRWRIHSAFSVSAPLLNVQTISMRKLSNIAKCFAQAWLYAKILQSNEFQKRCKAWIYAKILQSNEFKKRCKCLLFHWLSAMCCLMHLSLIIQWCLLTHSLRFLCFSSDQIQLFFLCRRQSILQDQPVSAPCGP